MRDFMHRALGGELCEATKARWDDLCKDYYERMGSPPGLTWHDVHLPFGISFDNAPIHKAFRKAVLVPRVPLLAEFRSILEHAIAGLDFNVSQAFPEAADVVTEYYVGKAARARKAKTKRDATSCAQMITQMKNSYTGDVFYVMVQFQQFPFTGEHAKVKERLATEVFDILAARFEAARTAYRMQNGFDWVSQFRRDQAFRDPRWLCFLPEQFMPLGNATPDLHQCAELLVGIYKGAMRTWTMLHDPDAREVLLAKNYDAELHATCRARNEPLGQTGLSIEQTTISNSIERTWTTAQIVAAPYGTWFSPDKPPDPSTDEVLQYDYEIMGTGGRFPGKRWA